MKRNNVVELHAKTLGELRQQLKDLQGLLLREYVNRTPGKEGVKPNKKREIKKDIARVLTLMSVKESQVHARASLKAEVAASDKEQEKGDKK